MKDEKPTSKIRTRIPHPSLSEDEVEAVLARPISAVIAFVDAHSFPRMVPCWFLWDDGAFMTTSDSEKFHVRCLRNKPKGSFCVEFEEVTSTRRSNRQVKGVGEFEILQAGADDVLARMREKYLGERGSLGGLGNDRVMLRLRPEKLSAHGGDLLLG